MIELDHGVPSATMLCTVARSIFVSHTGCMHHPEQMSTLVQTSRQPALGGLKEEEGGGQKRHTHGCLPTASFGTQTGPGKSIDKRLRSPRL